MFGVGGGIVKGPLMLEMGKREGVREARSTLPACVTSVLHPLADAQDYVIRSTWYGPLNHAHTDHNPRSSTVRCTH